MSRKSGKGSIKQFLSKRKSDDQPLEFKDKRQVDSDLARVPSSKAAKAKLEHRVATVSAANSESSYYQGFHDIAMHSHSTRQLENSALQQLRDFMATSMQPTQRISALIPELIQVADKDGIGRFFTQKEGEENRAMLGYFAVAQIVTLFSHDTDDSQVVSPIIRNVLKEGLAYVLYLYVASSIENPQLFEKYVSTDLEESFVVEDESTNKIEGTELLVEKTEGLVPITGDEIDMALSGAGSSLTRDNFEQVDRHARQLRSRYPLKNSPSFKLISRYSVSRTGKITKRSTALYTLTQLDRQAAQAVVSGFSFSGLTSRATSRLAVMAVAVSAVAFGVLWSRTSHR